MLIYLNFPDCIIAKFDTGNKSNKEYWATNITNNICRKLKTRAFYNTIFLIACRCVNRRTSFCGKMNEPPNEELGKRIAKQRLLAKYKVLEEKVYKTFLTYIKRLPCVTTLQDSHRLAIKALMDIQDSIDSFDICQQFINNYEGGLINEP